MFGLVRKSVCQAQIHRRATLAFESGKRVGFKEAIKEIRLILQEKDKVHLEPVTMEGSHQVVENSVFLGCDPGLEIRPEVEDVAIIGNIVR